MRHLQNEFLVFLLMEIGVLLILFEKKFENDILFTQKMFEKLNIEIL
jgi:hypothetical protein